jgi:hypothetical protein
MLFDQERLIGDNQSMRILSASDASVLARIAGNPTLAKKDKTNILSRLSSPESRQIAEALLGNRKVRVEALEDAKAIKRWTARQPKRSRRRRLAT